jgi:hypothetical protein
MEAIFASKTSVITTATQYKVPKDIYHCYRLNDIQQDRVLGPYIAIDIVT